MTVKAMKARTARLARFLLFFILSMFCLWSCGVSKTPKDRGGRELLPELNQPEKEVQEDHSLILKPEELKLSSESQEIKVNSVAKTRGANKYLKVRKDFSSPIQFNGWLALERMENRSTACAQQEAQEPLFFLMDDHGGEVVMRPMERIPISFEKLYKVRVVYPNDSLCQSVDIQFVVLYGVHE